VQATIAGDGKVPTKKGNDAFALRDDGLHIRVGHEHILDGEMHLFVEIHMN
jgi:hypothetical protein